MKHFCEVHGRWETSEIKQYWVERGCISGYLKMCLKAKEEKENNGWKVDEI